MLSIREALEAMVDRNGINAVRVFRTDLAALPVERRPANYTDVTAELEALLSEAREADRRLAASL